MPAIRASRPASHERADLQYPDSDEEPLRQRQLPFPTLSPLTIASSPLPGATSSPSSAVTAPPDSPESCEGESSPPPSEHVQLSSGVSTTRRTLHPPPTLPRLLPDPVFRFPQHFDAVSSDRRPATASSSSDVRAPSRLAKSASLSSVSSTSSEASSSTSSRAALAHPYARIYAKKADPSVKRRRMWNHALEKSVFTPEEIATLGAQTRRSIYTASLEAHVDKLHEQLRSIGAPPVASERLEPYHGLNVLTVKSMIAGLHKDSCDIKTKLMELERATHLLHRNAEASRAGSSPVAAPRRHSMTTATYKYPNLFSPANKASKTVLS